MNGLKGAVAAIVASLLVAILFAYLFRLPIPLGGYIGPFGEVTPYGTAVSEILKTVAVAWVFYGVLGGYIILATLGAVCGVWIGRKFSGSMYQNRLIVIGGSSVGVICVFVLSVLDYVIGPW